MSLADYAQWNEEATRVWFEEEGRHEPEYDPDDYLDHVGPLDAFAEDCGEMDTNTLQQMLTDKDYCERWPQAVAIIRFELEARKELE